MTKRKIKKGDFLKIYYSNGHWYIVKITKNKGYDEYHKNYALEGKILISNWELGVDIGNFLLYNKIERLTIDDVRIEML